MNGRIFRLIKGGSFASLLVLFGVLSAGHHFLAVLPFLVVLFIFFNEVIKADIAGNRVRELNKIAYKGFEEKKELRTPAEKLDALKKLAREMNRKKRAVIAA
jgi:hypothetical protein